MKVFAILIISALPLFGGSISNYYDMATVSNWAAVGIDNQLVTVANQVVRAARAGAQEPTNVVGENAASAVERDYDHWTIWEMQNLVEDHYDDFIDPNTNNVLEGITNAAPASYHNYTNFASFASEAGISSDGFRRVPGDAWPADWTDFGDGAYTNGKIQLGDIVGPWVQDDLQRCFDAMRIRMHVNVDWVWTNSTANRAYALESGIEPDEDYDSIWADAVAEFAVNTQNWGGDSDGPRTRVRILEGWSGTNKSIFVAISAFMMQLEAADSQDYITNANCEVEFYARSTAYKVGQDYDDNDQDILEDQWHQFGVTRTNPTTAVIHSSVLGTLDTPTKPELNNPAYPSEVDFYTGYKLLDPTYALGWHSSRSATVVTYEWAYTRP